MATDLRYGGYNSSNDPYAFEDPYAQSSRAESFRHEDPYSLPSRSKGNGPEDPYGVPSTDRRQATSWESSENRPQSHGANSNIQDLPDLSRVNSQKSQSVTGRTPVITYELDHLATFNISPKQGLVHPADGVSRLREMEASSGIWAMKVELKLNSHELIIIEKKTQKELEIFPISRVNSPASVRSGDSRDSYKDIVVFTVQSESGARMASEMHLFQCLTTSGQEIVENLEAAISGRLLRKASPRVVSPPVLVPVSLETKPKLPNPLPDYNQSPPPVAVQSNYSGSLPKNSVKDNVIKLNRCLDDIESFVASLQQSANALKELNRRRLVNDGHDPAEEALRLRAKPPSGSEFVSVLETFKVTFNILPRLTTMLQNPDVPQLLHMLFKLLRQVIVACIDERGVPTLPRSVELPRLTVESCSLLSSTLGRDETVLWRSLGPAWGSNPSALETSNGPQQPFNSGGYQQRDSSLESAPSPRPSPSEPPLPAAGQIYAQSSPQTSAKIPEQAIQLSRHALNGTPSPSQLGYLDSLKARGARVYVVLLGREGKNSKELSVNTGDVVEVLDSSKNWWKVRNHVDEVGFTPNTILVPHT